MGTGRDYRYLMKTGFGILLLVALLQPGTEAQICSVPDVLISIDENQDPGLLVTTITTEDNVILQNLNPEFPFKLEGKNVVTTKILDYETEPRRYRVKIQCTKTGASTVTLDFSIDVENLNDNPPTFTQDIYNVDCDEMRAIGSVVGTFAADDPDNLEQPTYTLTPEDSFRLKSPTEPEILVAKILQFDDIKTVELILTVQDSNPPLPGHTDNTTIIITIKDVDNRPPWFEPCIPINVEGVEICPHKGYSRNLYFGELLTGPLALEPNNIWAKDGDTGINETIQYSLLENHGPFVIDLITGDITQERAITNTKNKTIIMTVMAFQAVNTYQFATTSLIINMQAKSAYAPEFDRDQYEAVVEGVGTMAVETADNSKVLKMLVTDKDIAEDGGINHNIVFSLTDKHFSVIDGFLFMTADVPAGNHNFQVIATDPADGQKATAQISVEVRAEPTTTVPPTTTSSPTLEPTTGKTTALTPGSTAITTNETPNPTTKPDSTTPGTGPSTIETAKPSSNPTTLGTAGTSIETSKLPVTTEGTTGSTAHTAGEINPPGGFTSVDMAALGATLGVLLFISVVVITVLAVKLRKGNTDWKKINEASAFRSSLGPSGQKEGVQFTNEAFQHDDDDKDNKGGSSGGNLKNGAVPSVLDTDKPKARSIPRPPSPIQDDKKEVKPILSKDKSQEDGYKAVWFKEDIDPNAKEDVVIIPNSRAEEEDDDSEGEMKIPKVKFNDADVDSGLGEKIDDSEEERGMTSSL